MNFIKSIILAIAASLICFSNLSAQNIWLSDTAEFVGLEYSKATFKNGTDATFFSGVFHIYGAKKISEKLILAADVPIINVNDRDDSETTFGNIFLELKVRLKDPSTQLRFSAVLPTVDEEKPGAIVTGFVSEPNRMEVIMPWAWGLVSKLSHEKKLNDKGLYVRVEGGLSFLRDTKSVSQFDTSLKNYFFLDYGLQFGYKSVDNLKLMAGLLGRSGINSETEQSFFGERSLLLADLGISYKANRLEPGITVRYPLSDPFKDILSHTLTLSMVCHF